MSLHFIRSHSQKTYRPILLVVHDQSWLHLLASQIQPQHFRWLGDVGAWEIDAEAEWVLWRLLSDEIGLHNVCIGCLAGECSEAQQAMVFSAFQARLLERFQYRSTSRELDRPRVTKQQSRDLVSMTDAARILGIEWPTTRAIVVSASRRALFEAHPDRKPGGRDPTGRSDLRMRQVLNAREALLERL